MYFNYHAKIKSFIRTNHFINYKFVDKYNKISPALVFFFDCHKPMPVRKHKWKEYKLFLEKYKIEMIIPDDFKDFFKFP